MSSCIKSTRISKGFFRKRYWVLTCKANNPSEPKREIELLEVFPIYVNQAQTQELEDEQAHLKAAELLSLARPPCNCLFLFRDGLKIRSFTLSNLWLEAIHNQAIGHFETQAFESVINGSPSQLRTLE